VGTWITNESADGFTEAEGVTNYDPKYANNSGGDHAFDHGRDNVFAVYHSPVKEGETGSHEEYESGSDE
jgi:hypothetical protein